MSVTNEKEKTIEDEAYAVIESTNDDGTVEAEVISEPKRDGDDIVLEILPLIPTYNSKEVRMDWPTKESEEYDIVKICNEKVGGFQSVSNLKGVKLNIDLKNDDSNDFDVVVNGELKESGIIERSLLNNVMFLSAFLSFIGAIIPIVLLFLLPWNVHILSLSQGISMFLGSGILFIAFAALYDISNEL